MNESQQVINKKDLITYSSSFLAGAVGQVAAESGKIVLGSNLEKFPDGWNSFSFGEEILEGGLSAIGGAVSAKIIYYFLCQKGIVKFSVSEEMKFMYTGAALGYIVMAALLGPIIHQITGSPDVKWGPFQ